ncbi:MAG: DUF2510 domain-containing protein [Acidimicrobiales bacterium]
MSPTVNQMVPPGWYPDPGGTRSWRVWNGHDWTAVTRPFGEPAPTIDAVDGAVALRRVARVGVVAFFAGLGLLASTLAHWPGTAQPSPRWFALSASDLAVALLILATVLYAVAARALGGTLALAFIPAVNVLYVSALVTTQLHGPTLAQRRVLGEAFLLALFVLQLHAQPWLAVVPAFIALVQASNLGELQARRIGSTSAGT